MPTLTQPATGEASPTIESEPRTMTVRGLHHVSINVDDITAANDFYLNVLGLTQIDRPDIGVAGTWLEAENGLQVHLIELPGGGPDSNHMAFAVDDIDAAIAELRGKGLDVPDWTDIGTGRQVFLRDPSGNIVELNQQ